MSIAKRISDRTATKKHVDVKEWGEDGKPERVFFGPLLAGEMDKIQRKHPGFLQSASFAGMVDLIILKAETGDGEKLFTLEDKPILMREELNIIARVAADMMGADSVEDQEKN